MYNKFATLNDNQAENDVKRIAFEEDEEDDERPAKIKKGRTQSEQGSAKKSVAMLTKTKDVYMGACGKNVAKDASTWRRISIAVDSGACDNVISPDDVPEQTVFESVGSKKGENFLLCHRRANPQSRKHQDADGHARRHDARYVDTGCSCVKAVGIGEENAKPAILSFLTSRGRSSLTSPLTRSIG